MERPSFVWRMATSKDARRRYQRWCFGCRPYLYHRGIRRHDHELAVDIANRF